MPFLPWISRRSWYGAAAGPARGIAIVSIALVSVVSMALLRDRPRSLAPSRNPNPSPDPNPNTEPGPNPDPNPDPNPEPNPNPNPHPGQVFGPVMEENYGYTYYGYTYYGLLWLYLLGLRSGHGGESQACGGGVCCGGARHVGTP